MFNTRTATGELGPIASLWGGGGGGGVRITISKETYSQFEFTGEGELDALSQLSGPTF